MTITGENLKIENNTSNIDLVYGVGEFFIEQVKEQANQKFKLTIDSKVDKETQIEFKIDEKNLSLLEDIEIVTNENTKSTIIIKYLSDNDMEL